MSGGLRIAIASGKGGTGKTTIATSLARALIDQGTPCTLLDCDVEEPNCHILLRMELEPLDEVSVLVPQVDEERCTRCGACGRACRASAIVSLPTAVLTYPKLCHSCGGCALACPHGAIREVPRPIGTLDRGTSEGLELIQGRLNIGEAMAPPLIRAALDAGRRAAQARTLLIDAPPGTSCPFVEAAGEADVVALVTEPTPFGLNDLQLAVAALRTLEVPFGVVINRQRGTNDNAPCIIERYCRSESVPLLCAIDEDRTIAEATSRGILALAAKPQLREGLLQLHRSLQSLAKESPRRSHRPRVAMRPPEFVPTLPSADLPGPAPEATDLVVLSGKGGTGKTSIAASFAALADTPTIVDCDVDAADLHLVLAPDVQRRWPFSGGKVASVDAAQCVGCGICVDLCRFDALELRGDSPPRLKPLGCEGCGVCVDHCPQRAITLEPALNGEWFSSSTRHGPLVHAHLGAAQENSGKLVALLRHQARALSRLGDAPPSQFTLCDGSPGIGCPVIASAIGASQVLLVTEPTLAALHDLRRIAALCARLGTPMAVCINRADINPELTDTIEAFARSEGIPVWGRVRYDPAVGAAQHAGLSVVEYDGGRSPAAVDIRRIWVEAKAALVIRLTHGRAQLAQREDVLDPDHALRRPALPST